MKVIDFLKDYDIELGKLDTEGEDSVERTEEGVIKVNQSNIDTYREYGIDAYVDAAIDFNRMHIEDGQGNLFGDSVYDSAVSGYYSLIKDEFASTIAELFIKNSGGVKECEESDKPGECYIERVFEVMVGGGLILSFPVFTGVLGGAPVPIFNILPSNKPSSFATAFLSTLVPLSGASIFSEVSFKIQSSNFTQENKWVYTLPADEISSDKKSKLSSIFEPKNADIVYKIPPDNQNDPPIEIEPSKSALLFEAELDKVENEDEEMVVDDEYDINVSYPGFDNTFTATKDEQFYILEDIDDSTALALIKLPVYVGDEPLEITGTRLSNVSKIRKYNSAPIFNEGSKWFFVAKEPQDKNINEVDIKTAKIFDPPDFDISNIQQKSKNGDYEGFGATAFDPKTKTTKDVPAGKSLVEDFFLFYKDYLEQNFAVIHVGITSNGTPTVSAPEQLTVTLDP